LSVTALDPAPDFRDNTDRDCRTHPYERVAVRPLLVRPVWCLFDKIGDDRIAAVVLLGNPVVLGQRCRPGDLPARLDRDAPGRCVPGLAFYFGPYLAWALLPDARLLYYCRCHARAWRWSCNAAGQQPALVVMGLRRDRWRRFRRDAADLGSVRRTSMETFVRLMLFQSWI
jgi:hypothetical protein